LKEVKKIVKMQAGLNWLKTGFKRGL